MRAGGSSAPMETPGTVFHEEERRAQNRGRPRTDGMRAAPAETRATDARAPDARGTMSYAPGGRGPGGGSAENARLPVHLHEIVVVGESGGELARRWVQGEPTTVRFEGSERDAANPGRRRRCGRSCGQRIGEVDRSVHRVRDAPPAPCDGQPLGASTNGSDHSRPDLWWPRCRPLQARHLENDGSCEIRSTAAHEEFPSTGEHRIVGATGKRPERPRLRLARPGISARPARR